MSNISTIFIMAFIPDLTLFYKISVNVILVSKVLFQSFCMSFYCLPLLTVYYHRNVDELQVCYTNSLTLLVGALCYSSASQLFMQHQLLSFQEVHRKALCSPTKRLGSSSNKFEQSVFNSKWVQSSAKYSLE